MNETVLCNILYNIISKVDPCYLVWKCLFIFFGCIHFTYTYICMSAQSCLTFAALWTETRQTSLPMEFSRKEYWSALPFPISIGKIRGSSQPRDQTCISGISCVGRQILYHCTTWEANSLHHLGSQFKNYLLISIVDGHAGFPGGSASKESTCNAGDLWGHIELDTTERV